MALSLFIVRKYLMKGPKKKNENLFLKLKEIVNIKEVIKACNIYIS